MKLALIGGVSSTLTALEALIAARVDVTCVGGLTEELADTVSDFQSLRPPAEQAGIPYLAFRKVRSPEVTDFLARHPADMLWVIGLSQLVPDELIANYRFGGVGFHPTMLPQGRGRAPVAWTILKQARAAVNLFYLAAEADAGDIIVQREVPVLADDYSEDLIARTNEVLAQVITDLAPDLRGDAPLAAVSQDHERATFYEKRSPADGEIDWEQPTKDIYRLIRAAGRPYPGAFTHLGDVQLTVWRGHPGPGVDSVAAAGTVLEVLGDGSALVKTGDGDHWMTELETADPDDLQQLQVGLRLGPQ